jgi:hypothetical protein
VSFPSFPSTTTQWKLKKIRVCGVVFLGAFAKFGKAAISIIMSVGRAVRVEHLCSHWTDFHEM